jgi:ADP-ribose pyrophosphatase YjhB (NUDIX family)
MDWGEDIATTAHRELAEETGLRIDQIGRLVGVYSSPSRDARFHSVCIALEVHAIGIPKVKDTVEVLAVTPFPLEQVMGLELAHDHARHLEDYLAHKTVVA